MEIRISRCDVTAFQIFFWQRAENFVDVLDMDDAAVGIEHFDDERLMCVPLNFLRQIPRNIPIRRNGLVFEILRAFVL